MTENKIFLVKADIELQNHLEALEDVELVELSPQEVELLKTMLMDRVDFWDKTMSDDKGEMQDATLTENLLKKLESISNKQRQHHDVKDYKDKEQQGCKRLHEIGQPAYKSHYAQH